MADRGFAGVCAACQFPPNTNGFPSNEGLAEALPRFTILDRVGHGSMGCVFKAFDKDLERHVAIKVIPAEPGIPELVDRFNLEYRTMAGLVHPNIPVIFEPGKADSFRYYVFEWMKDGCLAKSGRLSVELSFHYFKQICAALEYAHGRRIIHRDIKPSNVLISGRCAKLADFGLTKRLDRPDQNLTVACAVVGTPGFMSPEQCHGDPTADERADIYGLAALFYYMLTGLTPEGRIRRPHHFGVPESFDSILLNALEPDCASRPQTVVEFYQKVEAAYHFASTPPRRWWLPELPFRRHDHSSERVAQ